MTDLTDRERAFEEKFAFDQEMRFKLQARRNRLLGVWAAGILGLEGPEAEAYALEVVASDLSHDGEDDVFEKLKDDFLEANKQIPPAEIRARMGELMARVVSEAESINPPSDAS